MNKKKVYLVNGKRTPFGKFGGALKDITPVDLSVYASRALLTEIKLDASLIDQVILGNVVPASTDTMYGGRHLALKLGCKIETPGICINRLCGSGIEAILQAARIIRMDEANCILASGTENMSMIPHLVYGSRFGTKYGALKTVDMLLDALTDQFTATPMGITAENLAEKFQLTRESCDKYSVNSHTKAAKAYKDGHLQGEITAIQLKKETISKDEHLREILNVDDLKKLPTTFKKDGVVTAASASGIVDGAASVIVASEDFCKKNNLSPLVEIIDGEVIGVDPKIMGIGPSPAIKNLMKRNNLNFNDIDLFEINEAFAAQTISCLKDLELPEEKLNVWGGAIALGHPLGASGVRISLSLARQINILGKNRGIASACIGGGQGIAMLVARANFK